jgi:hypothetical protein
MAAMHRVGETLARGTESHSRSPIDFSAADFSSQTSSLAAAVAVTSPSPKSPEKNAREPSLSNSVGTTTIAPVRSPSDPTADSLQRESRAGTIVEMVDNPLSRRPAAFTSAEVAESKDEQLMGVEESKDEQLLGELNAMDEDLLSEANDAAARQGLSLIKLGEVFGQANAVRGRNYERPASSPRKSSHICVPIHII